MKPALYFCTWTHVIPVMHWTLSCNYPCHASYWYSHAMYVSRVCPMQPRSTSYTWGHSWQLPMSSNEKKNEVVIGWILGPLSPRLPGLSFFGNRVTIFCSIAKRKLTQISGIDNDRCTRMVRSIVGKQCSAVAQSSWINPNNYIHSKRSCAYLCRSISHIGLWYCMTTPHLPLARTS